MTTKTTKRPISAFTMDYRTVAALRAAAVKEDLPISRVAEKAILEYLAAQAK